MTKTPPPPFQPPVECPNEQTKKLYVVSVSFEFAVLAESEGEARLTADEAAGDCLDHARAQVHRAVNPDTGWVHMPRGYDGDTLVYGTSRAEGDVTFNKAVEREQEALDQAKRIAAFLTKQGNLFVPTTTTKEKP